MHAHADTLAIHKRKKFLLDLVGSIGTVDLSVADPIDVDAGARVAPEVTRIAIHVTEGKGNLI